MAAEHAAEVEELVEELLPLAHRALLGAQQNEGGNPPEQRAAAAAGAAAGAAASGGEYVVPAAPQPERGAGPASTPQSAPRPGRQLDSRAVTAALLDYSLSIPAAVPSREMALAEFGFRNGFFLGQAATPAHTRWLRRAGVAAGAASASGAGRV